jgi:transposase
MGRLPEAWAAPHQVRELRELTRCRHKLVRIRASVNDQVHAILATLGIPVTCTDIFGVWGSAWLDELVLPQPYAGKMASLRKVCAVLADEIALPGTAISGLLEDHQGYRAVRALPGIGPVPGAVIVAGIGDISRFPRPAELCSRAGLTPRHRESDIKVSRGHITKQGSPILRWALIEAIQHVPAGHPLRQRKDDIIARRGDQARNIAKVAAARQLLTWVFYAIRDGQVRSLAAAARQAA